MTSEDIKMGMPLIYKAISNVMEDIGAVGKNQKNTQQNFMFRGIDAIMNAISPALIKHRVFIVPEILEQSREERTTKNGSNLIYSICKIRYTFFAEDGSSITAVTIGEGMDSGDKATNKAMAIAFKYACFQVFCITTEEMKDPDAESPEVNSERKKTKGTKREVISGESPASKVTDKEIKLMEQELLRTGLGAEKICGVYKVKTLSDMTMTQFESCMNKFKATPTKESK